MPRRALCLLSRARLCPAVISDSPWAHSAVSPWTQHFANIISQAITQRKSDFSSKSHIARAYFIAESAFQKAALRKRASYSSGRVIAWSGRIEQTYITYMCAMQSGAWGFFIMLPQRAESVVKRMRARDVFGRRK